MVGYQIKAMTKTFQVLALFALSDQVFAQDLSAGIGNETGNEMDNQSKAQNLNTSPTIDGLGTSNDYPVCHRMKNGVVKHQIQATNQAAIIE